jgi:hypothetical protein
VSRFFRSAEFSSLGLIDLITARDLFHAQLANLPNVIGTAVGRYLIRSEDPRAKDPHSTAPKNKPPRYIDDVVVTPWSWPAVLVFVEDWQETGEFTANPQAYIPPRLYLPDGRPVPTCVVAAPSLPRGERTIEQPDFSHGQISPGNAIMRDSQEQERVGTVSCLVTDGADIFALTSGHVIGDEGEDLYSFDDVGHREQVALATSKIRRCVPFSEAYPEWPGLRTFVNADIGIAKITDVSQWDARLIGGRRLGPAIDLNVDTLNLDLIGCPVKGYGAASGEIEGKVLALFYRYRSIGGFDYVADLMIGPREPGANVATRPGDSGAIWIWDAKNDPAADKKDVHIQQAIAEPRPLALQWGGYSAGGGSGAGSQQEHQFALATSLSLACRLLQVEFIRDLGFERGQFWGKTGHYKVAWSACDLLNDQFLSGLMTKNRESISVSDDDLKAGQVPMNNDKTFIALADVADLYWRSARPNDEANHFADMDDPKGVDPDNPNSDITLMKAWQTPRNRTSDFWNRYYEATGIDTKHRGALPFRAWQVYELLVEYAREAKLAEFVCAAGCVSHYLGDACQPLHVSYLHHGNPEKPEQSPVHSTYETKMLDRFVNDLIEGVNARLDGKKGNKTFTGGAASADHVVSVMKETFNTLAPATVIQSFLKHTGRQRMQGMWDDLGEGTMDCIALGAIGVAEYWEAAWNEGRSDPAAAALPQTAPEIAQTDLMALYRDKTFMPSLFLSQMDLPFGNNGGGGSGGVGNGSGARAGRTRGTTRSSEKRKTKK